MKATLIFTCIVLGVTAYNFDDAVYNQYLATDFQSIADDEASLYLRVRRENNPDKCHKLHFPLCCGAEEMEALHKEFREVKKECFKEVTGHEFFHGKPFDPFSCEDIETRKKELICVKECVAKKKGFANDDGSIIDEILKKHILENNKLEWLLSPKLENIITQCLTEAKEVKVEGGCNAAFVKFGHCMFRETQMACPEDKIIDPKRCEIVRQFVKTASFWPIPHH